MATPVKTAQGTWRIQIEVRGVRDSATLATKREAVEWGQRRTLALRDDRPLGQRTTLRAVLRRYAAEVTPAKRGNAKESIRLRAFEAQPLPLDVPIAEVTAVHLSGWRDARLKLNARGSVLRDISLLSSVFESARRDWGLIAINPLKDVRKPAQPDHRDRVISPGEIRGMLRALGYRRGQVASVRQAVAQCFLLALATGMRAGELCGLTWDRVYPTHVHLAQTKTVKRDVPLSPVAQRIIERMRGWDDATVFGLTPPTLDAMFRKYRDRAGLVGFRFHDSRHTAATRMAKQLHVLELCKTFGWANVSQALTYFNPSASDLAQKLTPKR